MSEKEQKDHDLKEFEKKFEASVEAWLDKKYAQFGRWTFGMIGVVLFFFFLKFVVLFYQHELPEFEVDQHKVEIHK